MDERFFLVSLEIVPGFSIIHYLNSSVVSPFAAAETN